MIDVRTRDEYDGSTPYGAARGGHIPSALHLHWKSFFHASGQLRDREEISSMLATLGVDRDSKVIVYCTGGVRSAFAYLVLRWWGLPFVSNYEASWWAWSADADLPVTGP